jgi:3-isopropylmalate/(R)-2-methylmalate dehydratase large subunit
LNGIGISVFQRATVQGGAETYKKSLSLYGFEEDDVMIGKPT